VEHLTERQQQVLAIIVNRYIETALPVGSKTIAAGFPNAISSATIRNEMVYLESCGLITHPHTSAGRIPTDRGYRLYVDVLPARHLDPADAGVIAWEFRQRVKSVEDLIERTSHVLAFLTEQASWVLFPDQNELTLKRIDLVPFGQTHILVVWTSTTGMVLHKILPMDEVVSEDEMARLNQFVNLEITGKTLPEVCQYLQTRLAEARDSLHLLYRRAHYIASNVFDLNSERRVCLDGSRYVVKQPEFQSDFEKAKRLFQILEERQTLCEISSHLPELQQVYVRIGHENNQSEIQDCALITSQYYLGHQVMGTLGVLGPKRMPYARVIGIVDHVARRLSSALEELL